MHPSFHLRYQLSVVAAVAGVAGVADKITLLLIQKQLKRTHQQHQRQLPQACNLILKGKMMQSIKKLVMKISSGCLFLSLFAFTNLSQAAAPSGQYGCMLNRNFGGFDAALNGGSNTGSTFMFYLSFDSSNSGTVEGMVQAHSHYGFADNVGSQLVIGGTMAITPNSPITGSYKTVISITSGGSGSVTLNLLSVNSGNTLLATVQSGTTDATRWMATGVCNKI